MSGDGAIIKADKDHTKEVDAAIPEAEKLAQVHHHWILRVNFANSSASLANSNPQ